MTLRKNQENTLPEKCFVFRNFYLVETLCFGNSWLTGMRIKVEGEIIQWLLVRRFHPIMSDNQGKIPTLWRRQRLWSNVPILRQFGRNPMIQFSDMVKTCWTNKNSFVHLANFWSIYSAGLNSQNIWNPDRTIDLEEEVQQPKSSETVEKEPGAKFNPDVVNLQTPISIFCFFNWNPELLDSTLL